MFGFFKKKRSANTAKDRLTIAIMTDRENAEAYPFMEALKAEIIEVVKKYIGVKGIDIKKETEGDIQALAIDIQLEEK